jgi:AraC family transcriptional regulator of adaptative response/methylated-DNA-[protein]-cysteine methyltransferase
MKIRYTIVDCSLGKLLIGATERGICTIKFASSTAHLKAALWRDYPSAEIVLDDKGLRSWASALLKYFQGPRSRIRKDGTLGGYSSGIARKRALLMRERAL